MSCGSPARAAGAHRAILRRIDVDLDPGNVSRNLDHDRARPAIFRLGKSTPHDVGDLMRQLHLLDRFGDRGVGARRFEHREQLGRLARVPERQEQNRASRSEKAVATPAKAFSAPGPYCIAKTPGGRPFDTRAKPSAICTPTRSWRHITGRMPTAAAASMIGVVGKQNRVEIAFALQDFGNDLHDLHRSFLPLMRLVRLQLVLC